MKCDIQFMKKNEVVHNLRIEKMLAASQSVKVTMIMWIPIDG